MQYRIARVAEDLELSLDREASPWRNIRPVLIASFHPASSDHRPIVEARLAYNSRFIDVLFHVRDRFVKSLCTEYQQMVCRDSCVEFFVQPRPDRGYFNFEVNCGGTMLLYYIEDATQVAGGFAKSMSVSPQHASLIQIATTMPKTTPTEIAEPIEWSLAMRIPFAMMEPYVGAIGDPRGQTWRGNLFKCGDKTSHPHWASWAPIGQELNFHQPDKFGELTFG